MLYSRQLKCSRNISVMSHRGGNSSKNQQIYKLHVVLQIQEIYHRGGPVHLLRVVVYLCIRGLGVRNYFGTVTGVDFQECNFLVCEFCNDGITFCLFFERPRDKHFLSTAQQCVSVHGGVWFSSAAVSTHMPIPNRMQIRKFDDT